MTRVPGVILTSLVLQTVSMLGPQLALTQLEAGSRIRVTTASRSHRGTLVSLDRDSLRFTPSDTARAMALPLASVVRLERSVGKKSGAGRGAVIGGLVGAGFGLFLGIAASADDSGWWEVGPGEVAAVTAITAAVGVGIGALIGSAAKPDRWEPIPLESVIPK